MFIFYVDTFEFFIIMQCSLDRRVAVSVLDYTERLGFNSGRHLFNLSVASPLKAMANQRMVSCLVKYSAK